MARRAAGPFYRRSEANQPVLKDAVIRDFSGGWNAVDNDLNLKPKFATVLDNTHYGDNGSIDVRFGTRLFVDLPLPDGVRIVAAEYVATFIVVVCSDGTMYRVNGDASYSLIWSDALARATNANIGWGPCDWATFCHTHGRLIILNGLDKPVVVAPTGIVSYLVDAVSGSNANVPIAYFAVQADRYLVLFDLTTAYIGAVDTVGTFYGDVGSDGVNVDLQSRVLKGATEITGAATFRGKLIVMFEECILIGTLGQYEGTSPAVHVPEFTEPIELYGAIGHRTIQSLGDDLLFCDIDGVPALERALFTGAINPARRSALIDPPLRKQLRRLNSTSLRYKTFSVYNKLEGQYMLFIPTENTFGGHGETTCYVFTSIKDLRVQTWARFRGWSWTCACRTALGNIFFGRDKQLFLYDTIAEETARDYIADQEVFSDGTKFSDNTGWSPITDVATSGIPITFAWELPWFDFGSRVRRKGLKYTKIDAHGTGSFLLKVFVDHIYEVAASGETFTDDTTFSDGYGFDADDVDLNPTLTMSFVGDDAAGFGLAPFGSSPYGGGRNVGDERLFRTPCRFSIMKYRLEGDTMGPLQFVAIAPMYQIGSIRVV